MKLFKLSRFSKPLHFINMGIMNDSSVLSAYEGSTEGKSIQPKPKKFCLPPSALVVEVLIGIRSRN